MGTGHGFDDSALDDALRVVVYRGFAATGNAPDLAALSERVAASPEHVVAALRRLAGRRLLVLDGAEPPTIVMAHPFSAIPLGFSVMGPHTLWWGGCAWDSFALPHLVPNTPKVLVATSCPACGRSLSWWVGRDAPPAGDEVAHFLVPVSRMWDDVVHTCSHQRLFCSREHVAAWLARHRLDEGSVLDLETLWQLARGWYAGRLDSDYRRREPSDAKDYLRAAGLSGAFWGLQAPTVDSVRGPRPAAG